jgi:hypothetical protein
LGQKVLVQKLAEGGSFYPSCDQGFKALIKKFDGLPKKNEL